MVMQSRRNGDLLLEALQTPLLAMASSGGVLVLACHFGPPWFAGVMAAPFVLFARSLYRRAAYLLERGFNGADDTRRTA